MFDGLQHRWLPLLISLNPEVTLGAKGIKGPISHVARLLAQLSPLLLFLFLLQLPVPHHLASGMKRS